MAKLANYLKEEWFLVTIIFIVIISYQIPALFLPFNEYTSFLVAFIMFLMGLSIHWEKMIEALKNIKAVIFTLIFTFIILPIIALGISRLFLVQQPELMNGFLIMAAVGGTLGSAIIWTKVAGGDDALSLVLATVVNILSAFISPVIIFLLLKTDIKLPILQMMQNLIIITILPIIVAQIVKQPLQKQIDKNKYLISRLTKGIILIFIGTSIAKAAGSFNSNMVINSLLLSGGLHSLIMLSSFYGAKRAGFNYGDSVAISYASAQKTLTTSLYIISHYFSPIGLLPCIAYHITQQFLAVFFVKWFKKYKGV